MSTTAPGGANTPDAAYTLGDLLARLTYRREKATYDGAVATLAPHWLTIAAAPAVFEAECLRNPRLRLAREAIHQKPEAPPMTEAAVAASPTAVRLKDHVRRVHDRDLDVESLADAVVILAETAGVSPDALWRLSLAEFGRRVLDASTGRTPPPPPPAELRPAYEANSRTLRVGDYEKAYKLNATRQLAAMAAFQAKGWTGEVLLAVTPGLIGANINDVVKGLNGTLGGAPIEFVANGNGTGIRWQWRNPPDTSGNS